MLNRYSEPWMFLLMSPGDGGGGSGGGFTREYVEDLRREAGEYRTKLRTVEQERDQLKTQVTESTAKIKAAEDASAAKVKAAEDAGAAVLTEVRTLLKLDAKADLAAIKAKVVEVQEAPNKVTAQATQALVKSAFQAAAAGRVVNPDAAFKLANLGNIKADLETLTVYPVDDKGQRVKAKGKDGKEVEVTGLDSVVESVLTDHPYLKGAARQIGTATNPPHTDQPKTLGQAIAARLSGQQT